MEQQQQPNHPEALEEMTWQEELQELTEQLLRMLPEPVRDFCREKARELIAGVAIVAMVVLLVYGYSAYSNMRENQAATAMGAALHAAKMEERIQGLEKVIKEYGSTDAADQATLLLGALYQRQGENKKAEEFYRKAEQRLSSGNPLAQAAMMGRGYLMELGGDEKGAKGIFQGLSKGDGPYRAVALLDYARAARLTGDTDTALAALNQYISLKPTAENLDYVRYQIVEMAAKEAKESKK